MASFKTFLLSIDTSFAGTWQEFINLTNNKKFDKRYKNMNTSTEIKRLIKEYVDSTKSNPPPMPAAADPVQPT